MPRRKKVIRKKKASLSSSLPKSKSSHTAKAKHQNVSQSTDAKHSRPTFSNQSRKTKMNNGEEKIVPPFNRFVNNRTTKTADLTRIKNMPQQTTQHPAIGLSSKERSFLICSCQARSSRYQKLKYLAANAIKTNKIFTVYGSCHTVRRALLERGWIEKITPNKMNLSKIQNGSFSDKNDVLSELEKLLLSNLVEKYPPNFVWRTKEEREPFIIDRDKTFRPINYPITNKLIDAQFTTKQGLCSSMKRNYWFYIEDVAEVNGPRTYSYDIGEIDEFVKDFKITACTSLLKWILSMVANERPVFVDTGRVSMNLVVFALNRCREYLFRKQNKDIDEPIPSTSQGQWNAFLKRYYRIISKDDVFKADQDNKLPIYLGFAKILLKEIHKYRPQLSCEGCHNIWIIKPAHNSRGRGIRMASKLGVIKNLMDKANTKYVIQKYIEEPLLIHETKFDIRQYYLVTSTYPLVIWMYQDCYLKFSSQKYNLRNYHESIHLTNNAVQKKYKNCGGRHIDLPQHNMWDLEKYKNYLYRIGKDRVWDNIIYPGMKKSIIGIMLNCQDSLSVCKNRFELYGCDFILDKEYKPWLIEINSCPDLHPTTQVTGRICPAVVADIIKVVVDYANDARSPTGNFECVYRQPMTMPRYCAATDLIVRGFRLNYEYFYRGNIPKKESITETNLDHKYVEKLLHKLQNYDTEIMVEPDESDSKVWINQNFETGTQNTESEFELGVEATVINDQLDELMERITSECSDSCQSIPSVEPVKSKPNIVLNAKSVLDVKSLVIKSLSRFASREAFGSQMSFVFSQLDN